MTEDAIRDVDEFKHFIAHLMYMAKRIYIYIGPHDGIERTDYASLIKFHSEEQKDH